jgi:hypothetical protein
MNTHVHGSLASQERVILLDVIVLDENQKFVEFSHFGTRFKVRAPDVLGIDHTFVGIPNPFGKGSPQRIAVRADAELLPATDIRACDLLRNVPFAIARPSLIQELNIVSGIDDTKAEQQWLRAQGIEVSDDVTMTTYKRTDSAQSTESRSGGQIDDQKSDGMSNDDATPSD